MTANEPLCCSLDLVFKTKEVSPYLILSFSGQKSITQVCYFLNCSSSRHKDSPLCNPPFCLYLLVERKGINAVQHVREGFSPTDNGRCPQKMLAC